MSVSLDQRNVNPVALPPSPSSISRKPLTNGTRGPQSISTIMDAVPSGVSKTTATSSVAQSQIRSKLTPSTSASSSKLAQPVKSAQDRSAVSSSAGSKRKSEGNGDRDRSKPNGQGTARGN
ncbi:hypothetical protein HDU93_001059, partial [Gonapodya sp. JEL0774]